MRGMMMSAALVGIASTLGSAGTLFAQGSVVAELYGQGVHDYFAGRYFESHDALSAAVAQGSVDPRCHYFRGLCLTRLGRSEEADEAFRAGAELEVKAQDRVYPVGRSLQRIQGATRLVLEKHRREARVAARLEAIKAQQARYEQIKRAENQVLRDPNRRPAMPAEELVGPAPPVDALDPFAKEEAPPVVAPPTATVIDSTAKPTEEKAATPSPSAPSTTPAAPAEVDPFSDPTPSAPSSAVDDPFGSAPDPAPAPAPSDDPFGDPFN